MLVAPLWIPMPRALYPRSQGSQTESENCHVSNTQNHKPGIRAQLGLCCMYLHVCVHAHMCGPTCIHVHVCVCLQLHGNLPGAGQGRHGGKIYSRPGELGDLCPCLLTQLWEFGRMTSSTLILRCPWDLLSPGYQLPHLGSRAAGQLCGLEGGLTPEPGRSV